MSAFFVFWLDDSASVPPSIDPSLLMSMATTRGLDVREVAEAQPAVHAALRSLIRTFNRNGLAFILVDNSLDTSEAFLDPVDYVFEGGPAGPLLDSQVVGYFEGVCRRAGCTLLVHVSDGVPDDGASDLTFEGEVEAGLRFLAERLATTGVVSDCLLALRTPVKA